MPKVTVAQKVLKWVKLRPGSPWNRKGSVLNNNWKHGFETRGKHQCDFCEFLSLQFQVTY